MGKFDALPPNLQPRGLSRDAAASYLGISPTKFDQLVMRGEMPQAKRIDSRKIWDRFELDSHFDKLPVGDKTDQNPWDSLQ